MDSWKQYAACLGLDSDMFMEEEEQAILVCSDCVVRTQCLRAAIESHARGVWGGTTTAQRVAFQQRTRLDGGIEVVWELLDDYD